MHGRAIWRDQLHDRDDARRITIGLLWHSLNSGNLGVGALTLANASIARRVATELGLKPHFVVMAARDTDVPAVALPDTHLVPIDWRGLAVPGRLWREMEKVDCVLDIGAGDSFTDIYGPRRFAFLIISKLMAIARRKPLIFAPQTIGPFSKGAYKAPAAWVMQHSRAVFARDELSREVALAMAPGADVRLSVDVAFELPFEDRAALRGGDRLRVGINVSGLLYREAEAGTNRFGLSYDYAAFTKRLLARLAADPGVEIHLISHATSNRDPGDDDGALADRLAADFPAAVRVPDFAGPSEAKSYISGLDLLVAARMHACIGAFSASVPVVPVAYSRKFAGLFGLLGYEVMVPISGVTEDQALALVMDALDRRAELAASERAGMERVGQLLDNYRAVLREAFASVSTSA